MFILRRITSEGKEVNTILGDSYNLVLKQLNEAEYKESLKALFRGIVPKDLDIYGFIIHDSGTKIVPLYNKSLYFIMTSNGNTFANITLK